MSFGMEDWESLQPRGFAKAAGKEELSATFSSEEALPAPEFL